MSHLSIEQGNKRMFDNADGADAVNALSITVALFSELLLWLGIHGSGIGICISIIGVLGSLYWTRRRVLAMEKQAGQK